MQKIIYCNPVLLTLEKSMSTRTLCIYKTIPYSDTAKESQARYHIKYINGRGSVSDGDLENLATHFFNEIKNPTHPTNLLTNIDYHPHHDVEVGRNGIPCFCYCLDEEEIRKFWEYYTQQTKE